MRDMFLALYSTQSWEIRNKEVSLLDCLLVSEGGGGWGGGGGVEEGEAGNGSPPSNTMRRTGCQETVGAGAGGF